MNHKFFTHVHRPLPQERREERRYVRCVNPERCVSGAHDGITYVETCKCGATREVNENGPCIERGFWIGGKL